MDVWHTIVNDLIPLRLFCHSNIVENCVGWCTPKIGSNSKNRPFCNVYVHAEDIVR